MKNPLDNGRLVRDLPLHAELREVLEPLLKEIASPYRVFPIPERI